MRARLHAGRILSTVCALGLGTALLASTEAPAAAATAVPAAGAIQSTVADDPSGRTSAAWRSAVTRTARRSPQAVLAEAPVSGPVRVVTVTTGDDGAPAVSVNVAPGRQDADAVVRRALADPAVLAVEVDAVVTTSSTDPYRDDQWAMTRLHAETVWAGGTGEGVVVAVVDTGVDATHPDLAGVVLPGADFVTGSGDGTADGNGHGTHVAGIIAALAGNGEGIAGLAPGARILPVRVLDDTGSGYFSDVAAGVLHAVDHGADVVNLSLGAAYDSSALAAAVSYAAQEGVLVVAAAGNARQLGNPVNYPGAYQQVIAVAASDSADHTASFSSSGSYVDVAAPGVAILSTVPSGYASKNGTSMAAPYVSAALALLAARFPQENADRLRAALESTAVDIEAVGRDETSGSGLVDVERAASWLAAPVPAPTSTWLRSAATVGTYGSSVALRVQVTRPEGAVAGATVRLCLRREPATSYTCTPYRADANGAVSAAVKLTGPTHVYAAHPASTTTRASTTSPVRLGMGPVTRLSARKAGLGLAVTPARGQTVKVQRLTGGVWKTVTTRRAATLSSGKGATMTITGLRSNGTYRALVSAVPGLDAVNAGSVRTR